jgi:uncharacterized protein UPF0014
MSIEAISWALNEAPIPTDKPSPRVLGAGVVPPKPIAVVPIAGIVIGGAMTATSQAARRALDELKSRHGEYEAALALGFLPPARRRR